MLIKEQTKTPNQPNKKNKDLAGLFSSPFYHLFHPLGGIGNCCCQAVYPPALPNLSKQLHLQMCIVQCVAGQVRGLWLLLHYRCWALTKTPLVYPAVPATMVPQDQFPHMLQQVIDKETDVGVLT